MVQAFKVGDEKRKNGLEYKCASRKCPHFELSDIIMLAAPQKTSLFKMNKNHGTYRSVTQMC